MDWQLADAAPAAPPERRIPGRPGVELPVHLCARWGHALPLHPGIPAREARRGHGRERCRGAADGPAPSTGPSWPGAARRGGDQRTVGGPRRTERVDAPRPAGPFGGRPRGRRRGGERGRDRHRRDAGAVRRRLGRSLLRRARVPRWWRPCTTSSDYDNAFWDGTQLVFGDGDGQVFGRFTKPVDVLGHEFTHAVTAVHRRPHLPGPVRRAQRVGVRRVRRLRQAALLGPGRRPGRLAGRARASSCPASTAAALRVDGATPARRTTTRELGKDPQVGSTWPTTSTRPTTTAACTSTPASPTAPSSSRRAAIGGAVWSGAGRIWYAALTCGLSGGQRLRRLRRGHRGRRRMRTPTPSQDAWATVGVTAWSGVTASRPRREWGRRTPRRDLGRPGRAHGRLRRAHQARARSTSTPTDSRAPAVRRLVQRIDFRAVDAGEPRPDRFVYRFAYLGAQTQVHEQASHRRPA